MKSAKVPKRSCPTTRHLASARCARNPTLIWGGRLRSRSKADQERLASHRGYGRQLQSCVDTYAPIAVVQPRNWN
ncbi:hypothetical protein [Pseudomonas synxantha]|nr:hypothetical protein [Pseudomonas synxantha]